jgi:predicted aspartyl protease
MKRGRGPLIRNLILAAVLSAFAALPVLGAESCTLTRHAVIPFTTDNTAHIYLPATLADHPTRLMVDTGGSWSLINEPLAERLGLKIRTLGDGLFVDASGAAIDKYVVVPGLKLGDLSFPVPVEFFIARLPQNKPLEEKGGTLGLNIFTHMDLEIDNAAKTVTLFTQNNCAEGDAVYWADEAVTLKYRAERSRAPTGGRLGRPQSHITLPIVGAELEGEDVRVLFDTGSAVTSIDIDLARRRFGIGPGSPGVQPAGRAYLPSGRTVDLYTYTFKTLTISGIRFENVPVRLGKFDDTAELTLGMHELKLLRIYFAFKDGLIHVTAADAKRSQ